MQYSKIFSIACLTFGVSAFACSSSDSTPPPMTANCNNFDYSKYTPGSTQRTAADLMPIFSVNCTTTVCHAGTLNPPAIGDATATAASISAALVNVTSLEVPAMKYVVPGDASNSYLLRKLDSTNPGCGLACTNPPGQPMGCATQMPNGLAPLMPTDQLNTIRDWVIQGAH